MPLFLDPLNIHHFKPSVKPTVARPPYTDTDQRPGCSQHLFKRFQCYDVIENVISNNTLPFMNEREYSFYALAPALLDGVESSRGQGGVDAVVITGGMARSGRLVERLRRRAGFVAPFVVLPDVEEMQALAAGGLRVLRGEEVPREYTGAGQDLL